jgi:hypothetical protein
MKLKKKVKKEQKKAIKMNEYLKSRLISQLYNSWISNMYSINKFNSQLI